jgi:peptide deformylase
MAIRRVLRMGDPRLLQRAQDVAALDTRSLHDLVTDLKETMAAEEGVGLAAPQIGVGLRVVVFGYEHNARYPDAPPVPETVLVNPVIEPLSRDMDEGWEACLSVPGLRGLVPRHTRILYRGFEPSGVPIERVAEGFHARVVQHERDHLDGVLYLQRMRDLRSLGFTDELYAAGVLPGAAQPCDSPCGSPNAGLGRPAD